MSYLDFLRLRMAEGVIEWLSGPCGFTRKEAAQALGVSPGTLRRWEQHGSRLSSASLAAVEAASGLRSQMWLREGSVARAQEWLERERVGKAQRPLRDVLLKPGAKEALRVLEGA